VVVHVSDEELRFRAGRYRPRGRLDCESRGTHHPLRPAAARLGL
jgi:hypothetical protein